MFGVCVLGLLSRLGFCVVVWAFWVGGLLDLLGCDVGDCLLWVLDVLECVFALLRFALWLLYCCVDFIDLIVLFWVCLICV